MLVFSSFFLQDMIDFEIDFEKKMWLLYMCAHFFPVESFYCKRRQLQGELHW